MNNNQSIVDIVFSIDNNIVDSVGTKTAIICNL